MHFPTTDLKNNLYNYSARLVLTILSTFFFALWTNSLQHHALPVSSGSERSSSHHCFAFADL